MKFFHNKHQQPQLYWKFLMPFSLKLECMSKNSCNKSCHVTYSNSSCSLSGKGCGEGGTLVCELAQSQVKVHLVFEKAGSFKSHTDCWIMENGSE